MERGVWDVKMFKGSQSLGNKLHGNAKTTPHSGSTSFWKAWNTLLEHMGGGASEKRSTT